MKKFDTNQITLMPRSSSPSAPVDKKPKSVVVVPDKPNDRMKLPTPPSKKRLNFDARNPGSEHSHNENFFERMHRHQHDRYHHHKHHHKYDSPPYKKHRRH